MWNQPTEEQLRKLPALYSTENLSLDQIVMQMHFFLGGCDWYVAEYNPADNIFFGYAILNSDLDNAEWGYVSYEELRSINVKGFEIDRDIHWTPKRAVEIDKIKDAYVRQGKQLE